MPLLEGRGLTKLFGRLVAVDHVDLAVEPGEIVGLIGPNGAGKTTLVNLITGLEAPTDGTVTFDGHALRGLQPPAIARLGLARTFQIAQPFRTMTVRQNVAVPALFRGDPAPGVAAALREADAVLEIVGLGPKRDLPARALTTPDLRRLELAKALALRPRLMLLDEVMAAPGQRQGDRPPGDRARAARGDGPEPPRRGAPPRPEDRGGRAGPGHRRPGGHSRLPRHRPGRGARERAAVSAAAQEAPLLQVQDLDAGYGAVQVLWEVSLDVRPGETVALIGPNGAGKSTLLRTISGLGRPWRGQVRFGGREITALAPEQIVRLGVAHVPQGRRLFADLSVRENLLLGAYARDDAAGIAADFAYVLDLFPALRDRLTLTASQLSGGEQQMAAVARALMAHPRLLLIDEPSLGLAPIAIRMLMGAVDRLRGAGTSVLLVEQDVAVALHHADRGYVLETGRIVLRDAAPALLNNPQVRNAYLGLGAGGPRT